MLTHSFDLQSVFILTTFVALVTATTIGLLWRSYTSDAALADWAIGSLLVGVGFFGVAMRNWLPIFVSISLANACVASGHMYYLRGIQRLYENKVLPTRAIVALGVVVALMLFYFTSITFSTAARMVVMFLVLSLISFITAAYLLQELRLQDRGVARIVAGIFAIYGSLLLIRIVLMMVDKPEQNLFAPNRMHEVVFVAMLLFYASMMFCFPALLFSRDISARMDREEELKLAATVFHNSTEGVIVTDADAIILFINPAFEEITGYSAAEALGRKPSMLRSDRHDQTFYQEMWHTLLETGKWEGEIWNRRKNGEAYLEWLMINRILNAEGKPIRYASVFRDITEMRSKDERIRHLAFHDALTGLPNRALFQERLDHAVERMRRIHGRLALIFIDLDGFKIVNDSLGHDMGDLLLVEVANRIRAHLRRGVDTVARLGGDEFVVLMEDIKEAEHCACLAGEIIKDISRPIELRGPAAKVGASMGIAFFPDHAADGLTLMQRADTAMYAAKAAGKGGYRLYGPISANT